MTNPNRIQRNNKEYRDKWRARSDRPKATCHPDRNHRARGLCDACYDRWLYANSEKYRNTRLKSAAKWASANQEKKKRIDRNGRLKRRYNIDENGYKKILRLQDGKCAICFKEGENLHVDHCHQTGLVRGLLCLRCNGSLAWVEEILRKKHTPWFNQAREYLNDAKKNPKTKG